MVQKMKNKLMMGTVLVACSMLSACATVVSGSSQPLNVQAVDAETHQVIVGAKCTVRDDKGVDFDVQGNPGVVQVHRAKGPLKVSCMKAGYQQAQVGVGTSFNGWTVVDIVFWPGFIVDGVSGAYSSYKPSHVTVLMSKNGSHYVPAKTGTVQQR